MSLVLMIAFALTSRVAELWPRDLDADSAAIHVQAAEQAGKNLHVKEGATELLLALAWTESRFDPTATSRKVGAKRKVGSWRSTSPAGQGPWFCGVVQTMAYYDWNKCLEMRDISKGYKAGVEELNYWLDKTHGNVIQALNGHQCGNIGPTTACGGKGYGARVFALAQKLKRRPTS